MEILDPTVMKSVQNAVSQGPHLVSCFGCHPDTHNDFLARDPTFLFCTGPIRLGSQHFLKTIVSGERWPFTTAFALSLSSFAEPFPLVCIKR